jgi:His-Xaa-Ser system protein HxsD
MNNAQTDGNVISISISPKLYSKDSIFKCLYWYGDKFDAVVSENPNGNLDIKLQPRDQGLLSQGEMTFYRTKLQRDLIDFNLRDIVTKETQNVRDLLVAKAFSNGEFDETPKGEVSDPVGLSVDKMPNV